MFLVIVIVIVKYEDIIIHFVYSRGKHLYSISINTTIFTEFYKIRAQRIMGSKQEITRKGHRRGKPR